MNLVNLKAFSPQLTTQLWTKTQQHSRLSLLGALLLLGTMTVWCEARQIDWDTLNLSPNQEVQMQRLESSWQKTHQEVTNQIDKDTAEMKELLPSGNSQRIRQLQNRISTNKMYLMNESTDTFLKKRDMLTPVQRTQLMKMMPSR